MSGIGAIQGNPTLIFILVENGWDVYVIEEMLNTCSFEQAGCQAGQESKWTSDNCQMRN